MLFNQLRNYTKHSWLLAIVISFIVLYPTLNNGFVNWDDHAYVLENQLIQDLSFEGIKAIFKSPNLVGNYHPLTALSLAIDYSLGEFNPKVYHAHNLLLHLLNVFLVFLFIKMLTKQWQLAFIVSLLFGIHPMHLESVAWISARKDVLYAFYFLLGLISYLKYLECKKPAKRSLLYLFCFLTFLFSLLSKSMAIVFPVILIGLDLLKSKRIKWTHLMEKLPFLILSTLFIWITIYTQSIEGAVGEDNKLPLLERLALSSYSLGIYIFKLITPVNLSALYPYPFQKAGDFPSYLYSAFLIIPLLVYALWLSFQRNRMVFFGFLLFLVSLAPVLQLLPFGRAILAERYTYMAYIGLFLVIAQLFVKATECFKSSKKGNILWYVGATLYIVFFCSISLARTSVWKNGYNLWTDVIESFPEDYYAYSTRGEYFLSRGNFEAALVDLNKSIELYPNYMGAYNLRGRLYEKLGDHEQAKQDFLKSIELKTDYISPYVNLSKVLATHGKYNEAINYLNAAVGIDSNYSALYLNRGVIYEKLNRPEEAIASYSKAILIEPKNSTYYRYRGVTFLFNGLIKESIEDFSKAIELNEKDGLAYFLRAKAYVEKAENSLAIKDVEQAGKLNYKVSEEFKRSLGMN